jgi:GT2 family glycosyltransferase
MPSTQGSARSAYSCAISIVVVTWNAKEFVDKCLASLQAQTAGATSEIIAVDNASSDGTYELIRDAFPSVKLIQSGSNCGFAKANNLGIAQCRGDYVFLVNPDVVLGNDCLASLCCYMDEHPEVGIAGPKILNPDLTIQESCKEFPTLWNSFCRALALDRLLPQYRLFSGQLMRYWAHDSAREVDILSGCFWVVRSSALAEVGLLDEGFFMYAEDRDWCKRFWDAGWHVVYYPGAEAIHYGAASSSREPVRFYLEMSRANLRYWKKHHGAAGAAAIRLVMLLHETLRILGNAIIYVVRPPHRRNVFRNLQRSFACAKAVLLGHLRG